MKKILWFPLLLIAFFHLNCSSNNYTLLNDSQNCTTTIYGTFTTPKEYQDEAPAVILKKTNLPQIKLGSVVSQNKDGVFFLRKSLSFLDSPDTTFIELANIRAIIDTKHFCAYGDLEPYECKSITFKFYLEKLDDADYQPIYLPLVSHNTFSFCMKPGRYKITKIIEEYSEDYYYESFPVADNEFEVVAGRANYVGAITMLPGDYTLDDCIKIPFFKHVKTGNASAAFGFLGALIGGISNLLWKKEIRGYYYIKIDSLNNHKLGSGDNINLCPIKFSTN